MTALLLAVCMAAAPTGHYVGVELLGPGGGPIKGTLTIYDDIKLCYGDTTCDFWEAYNSTGTAFELWHDDSDGGGTPGVVRSCAKGGNDCTFSGALTISGGVNIDADNVNLTLGAAADSRVYFDGTNVRLNSSGSYQFDAPIITGTLEAEADTGDMTWFNQEMSASLADGTEVCNVASSDSNNTFAWCAEADGAGGVDVLGTNFGGLYGMLETCRSHPYILDFAAGAASVTWTGALPVGAYRVAVTGRIIEADTGACTAIDMGDGADQDLYAAGLDETSITETFGSADHTATLIYNEDTSGAGDIVATGVGGNCDDARILIVASYCISTGPTVAP